MDCPTVKTAGDGRHYYYKQPNGEPLGNRTGSLPEGIDVRGAGGWIIAPGTVRPDGARWEPMEGAPSLVDTFRSGNIPALPATIAELIRKTPKKANHSDTSAKANGQRRPAGKREQAYARVALERAAAELAGMAANSGRNNKLNETAFALGTMVARGWIDQATVTDALWKASENNGLVSDDAEGRAKDIGERTRRRNEMSA